MFKKENEALKLLNQQLTTQLNEKTKQFGELDTVNALQFLVNGIFNYKIFILYR